MVDLFTQLGSGFLHCLTPLNLAMLMIGISIGLRATEDVMRRDSDPTSL